VLGASSTLERHGRFGKSRPARIFSLVAAIWVLPDWALVIGPIGRAALIFGTPIWVLGTTPR
jgi:hypothetical protein